MELTAIMLALLLASFSSLIGGSRLLAISQGGWGMVAVVGLVLYGLISGAAGYFVSSMLFLSFGKNKKDKEAQAKRRRWSIAGAVLVAGGWAIFLAHRKPL